LAKTNRMIRLATPALSLDAAQSKQAGTSARFQISHKPGVCAHTAGIAMAWAGCKTWLRLLYWHVFCFGILHACMLFVCWMRAHTSALKALGACTHTSTVHIHKQCVRSARGDATVKGILVFEEDSGAVGSGGSVMLHVEPLNPEQGRHCHPSRSSSLQGLKRNPTVAPLNPRLLLRFCAPFTEESEVGGDTRHVLWRLSAV
jgi:hypothetical protein